MGDSQAKITSVEALRHFHQQTLGFNEEALQVLSRLRSELKRACHHVEFELPAKLKHEHEKWQKILAEANKELYLSVKPSSDTQQLKRQAMTRVYELEDRIEKIKQWKQRLNALILQPESQIVKLQTFLTAR